MIKRPFLVLVSLTFYACSSPTPVVTAKPTTQPHPTVTAHPSPTHTQAISPSPTTHSTPTALPTTTILFTGDINPGRCIAKDMIASDNYNFPYEALAPDLRAANILVGSLDGSITDKAEPADCPQTMSLNGPKRVAEGLLYAGFDLITVATNHAKNCGIVGCWDEALLDSIANLSEAGILSVGGGENLEAARQPVIIKHNGIKFAFLGASTVGAEMWATQSKPGTSPLISQYIVEDIQAARQRADVVIVLAQWGSEYTHVPNWDQFNLADDMMKAGATLVIVIQAHWVQAVEMFPNGVVAYGLGNFVFDQNWSVKTQQGVLFEATFEGNQLKGWRLRPIHISDDFQPIWADDVEAAQILDNIELASHEPPLTTRTQP